MRWLTSLILVALIAMVPGCGAPDYQISENPRGEVNGRSFEFVSTKPDGTEWTFRVRGNSLWVGFVEGSKTGELGTIDMSDREQTKMWRLIDMVDVGGRRKGHPDRENGTVILRLREPTDEGDHDLHVAQVSRHTDDEDVLALANYLIDLVEKHKHVSPAF